jgi:hypothetical protein
VLSGSEPEFLTPEKSFKTSCRIGADPSNLIVEVDAFMQTSMRHSVDVRVVTFIVTPEIVAEGVGVGVAEGVGVGVAEGVGVGVAEGVGVGVAEGVGVGVAEGVGVGVGVEVLVSEIIAGNDGVGEGVGVGEVPIGSLV